MEAHSIEQLVLHLFVRQVVEVLEHQDAHHDCGEVWRAPALAGIGPEKQLIDESRQMLKVDVLGDDLQRVTQGLDLALACLIGEQVELECAASARMAHGGIVGPAGALRGQLREVFRSSPRNRWNWQPCNGWPWFNHHRLLEPIGHIPPAQAEANYYRQLANHTTMMEA